MNVRGVSSATLLAMSLVGAVIAPIAASAAPAGARLGAAVGESEQQVAGGNAIAWGMAALIAGFTAYLILSDDDDEDEPASP